MVSLFFSDTKSSNFRSGSDLWFGKLMDVHWRYSDRQRSAIQNDYRMFFLHFCRPLHVFDGREIFDYFPTVINVLSYIIARPCRVINVWQLFTYCDWVSVYHVTGARETRTTEAIFRKPYICIVGCRRHVRAPAFDYNYLKNGT